MSDFSVLLAVALPESGPRLLDIARLLAPPRHLRVTALHCQRPTEAEEHDATHGEDEQAHRVFELLERAAGDVAVDSVSVVHRNVEEGVVSLAREREADLIMLGWHRPMVPHDEQRSPVHGILERSESDVAILLARQFQPVRRVLVPFHGGKHDRRALNLAARIARSSPVEVTVLHVVQPDRPEASSGMGLSKVVDDFSDGRVRLKVVESEDAVDAAVREAWAGYDLIVAGTSELWGGDACVFPERLQQFAFATPASLLVVHASSARHPEVVPSTPEGHLASTELVASEA